jgi:hypothetical protein
MATKGKSTKYVYYFGGKQSEGKVTMKTILGGKGANLADMCTIGLPVPPGFTVTTEACDLYYKIGKEKLFKLLESQVGASLKKLEKSTGKTFGHGANPLLVSVRSGAAASMPGMMDTVLNLGLNPETVEAMIKLTGNERFVLDSYRRFIQMFGDVVLGVEHHDFEHELDAVKKAKKVTEDTDLDTNDLRVVVARYKALVKKQTRKPFPDDPMAQLYAGINAVFGSWNNPRAIKYRELSDIRGLLGTAVNVQSMVTETPEQTPLRALRSHVTHPQAKTNISTVNTSSTPKAKTWLQVSVPHSRSPLRDHANGPPHRALRKRNAKRTSRPFRKRCLDRSRNWTPSAPSLKSITATCRTLSSPLKMEHSTCCRRVAANAPRLPRSKSRLT